MGGKRPGCYNVTSEQKQEMQRLRNEGRYVKEIASMFRVSCNTVRNHTKPKYIHDGYSTIADRDMAIVRYRDEHGMTWSQIGRKVQVTKQTAINRYRRYKNNEGTR